MTELQNQSTQTTQVTSESSSSGRAHLSLSPTAARTESQRSASVDAYLADQKEQQAMSHGRQRHLDIDEAYNLGVGVKSTWYEPGASTTVNVRQVDPQHKAHLDNMLSQGLISQKGYETEIRGILGDDPFAEAPPEADLAPLQYDTETSNNARWTMSQVGQGAFNNALVSYAMGDSTAAVNLANQLQEQGVTPSDITGLYDTMAQTAAGKIAAVMEANGDHDVSVSDVINWAKSLEPGQQVYHLTRTVMAEAIFDNFKHVPEVVQKFRLFQNKRR